ncbi:Apoptosis inhibitor 5 [Biomphalaria glabrata]|uniref:Apoptosis inhibitor 5-like isoform X1 n=2 Tax=Biomphalaria glabrata TaxID=6526 RepID=A0A9W3BII5_BIOGL|nr:apoptosis inhibitor 5-like isoform X1 [Biomphalaria glabrata]KAI8761066.1 apoptosis inhibitor 5-like; partial [Biomphalaria glabrata]
MTTVEELYKAFEVLADAKEKAGEHESEFLKFLAAGKGNVGEKRLASQFICRFFKYFTRIQDDAINLLFELCEDPDPSIRKQSVKDILTLCRASPDKVSRFADALAMLFGTEDSHELSGVQSSMFSLFSINLKGALEGIFGRLLQISEEEDNSEELMGVIRERLLRFLVVKLKQMGDLEKECEDLIMEQCKKLLEDVTKDEFIAVMELLRSLKTMTTVQSRQQLVEMVVDQAALDEPFEASDPDCVDRLLHCIRSASPMFSKNVHSRPFVQYICDHVLPVLKDVVSPDEETNIQLEVLKTFAEISEFAGDVDKLDKRLNTIFSALLEFMPLPPSDEKEESTTEEPKLNFSQVECLIFAFHQLARKSPGFLTDEVNGERLKDFRVRLQYIARGSQICIKRLKEALQGTTGDALKTEENKKRIVALKLFTNITMLVKDLMHNPPSYKVALTLSWRPSREIKPAESNETAKTLSPGQKRTITPITYDDANGKKSTPKQARTLYQPPGGKFSDKAGTFTNFSRGGNRGGRGRGNFRARGRRGMSGSGFYQNKL